MAIEIHDMPQGTPEWHQVRLGIPTASMFGTVMAKGKDGGASVTRRTYLMKLAGEILTGEPCENYTNGHMERGKLMEAEARSYYEFISDDPVRQIGFIRNGAKGASPDSLVGEAGMLEIKTAFPHILGEILLKDNFPPEHMPQAQGNLWVAEREWLDIVIYWPSMPKFIKRVRRDDAYIAKLAAAVDEFNAELSEIVHRLRSKAA